MILVEEAITSGIPLRGELRLSGSDQFHHTIGGGLGWGIGAAIGVKLGNPGRPVVAALGDGSALYSIQGLWTAAHHGVGAVFVILNNRQYRAVKQGVAQVDVTEGSSRNLGVDLTEPAVDFLALARSFGVEAHRVERAGEVAPALEAALALGRPSLLEIPIQGSPVESVPDRGSPSIALEGRPRIVKLLSDGHAPARHLPSPADVRARTDAQRGLGDRRARRAVRCREDDSTAARSQDSFGLHGGESRSGRMSSSTASTVSSFSPSTAESVSSSRSTRSFPTSRLQTTSPTEAAARASELLERFHIAHLAAAKPGRLSGGERQRVALARALARDPAVLLLDEPLSALDAHTRAGIRAELQELLRELGLPTLLVTHDFEDAAALAERVGVIVDGRILQLGTPRELLEAPASPFVASFTGGNLLAGLASPGPDGLTRVELDDGNVVVSTDEGVGRVGVIVQPWEISLTRTVFDESALNHIPGQVSSIVPLGNRVRVRVGPFVSEITAASAERLELRTGDRIIATFKATATKLVPLG